ncbi:putative cyclin-B3-1 isoform X2 [Beta vulgaris subsp. vulgaris]|uniref:putative cyclin-B3-1 isoform X2 n=1 Tax=Beta vulgaris subsp. vulgaris TaxID=3555 RepID=UPI002037144F|nr:putative cyclin-B3-1 isoform X2 [Beta vulgaris subsp. vulgaris]
MVILKGKSISGKTKSTERCELVSTSKFKVYSEKVNGRFPANADAKFSRTSLMSKTATLLASNTGSKTKMHVSGAQATRSSYDSLDKTKVGRKVLADVSNIQGQSSKFEKPRGLRSSMAFGTLKSTASSGQFVMPSNNHTRACLATAHTKAQRTFSNFDRIQVTETTENITRQIPKSSNTITRKSLPVMKKANRLDSSDLQGNIKSEEKSTRKVGFPVKGRAGGKLVSQVSNLTSKVSREKVSDGSTLKAMRNQTNNDAHGRVRKSVKPIARTCSQTSYDPKNFKSKSICSLDKTLGTISMRRVKVATSTVAKSFKPSGSCEEVTERGGLAQGRDNLKPQSSDTTAMRNSGRRKSYTSSLISRSKLLKLSNEIREQEQLPNIDDEGNPLEVAEYVDEIYDYYWLVEAQSSPLENYMIIQTDATPQMRGLLINWLIEVHDKFDLMPETLYLTVALLDRYLSLVTIKKKELQLVGLASLLLASKYEDFWHPRVKDLISISAESYTRKQMLEMEKSILKKLKFRLNLPTAYVFMLRFLKASQSDKRHEHLSFYLIELCLVKYESLRFRPSLLCASAVYVARCTLNEIPAWTSLLEKHARTKELQIRDCAEMIVSVHKSACAGLLKVTYDKYMQPKFGGIAAVKPLDRLPI